MSLSYSLLLFPFPLCLSLCVGQIQATSRSESDALWVHWSHSLIHSLSLGHTHTLSRSHTLSLSLTHTLSRSHTLSLSVTHTLSRSHTLSFSVTHTLSSSFSPVRYESLSSLLASRNSGRTSPHLFKIVLSYVLSYVSGSAALSLLFLVRNRGTVCFPWAARFVCAYPPLWPGCVH